jgi:acylphosphatase
MNVRRHLWVKGRVQGVWFRDSCAREADRLGVTGWVRNVADGRVEAVLEGGAAAVETLVEWCRHGPPRARVDDVVVHEEDPQGDASFDVR